MDSGKIINDELGILSFAQLCYARLGLVELSCVKSCFLICGGWKFLTAIRKILTKAGRSIVIQPKPRFKSGSIRWFDDSKLLKTNKEK